MFTLGKTKKQEPLIFGEDWKKQIAEQKSGKKKSSLFSKLFTVGMIIGFLVIVYAFLTGICAKHPLALIIVLAIIFGGSGGDKGGHHRH